jgi:hypothetical protein
MISVFSVRPPRTHAYRPHAYWSAGLWLTKLLPRALAGVSLNEQNMVTVPGPAGTLAGLRVWDKIIMVDNVVVGKQSLVATMSSMTPKPTHTLTVLRKGDLGSYPPPSTEVAAPGWRLVPSQPVPSEPEPVAAAPSAAAAPAVAKGINPRKLSAKVGAAPAAAQTAESPGKPDKPDGIVAALMNAAAGKMNTRVSRAPASSAPVVTKVPSAPVVIPAPVPSMVSMGGPLPPIAAVS